MMSGGCHNHSVHCSNDGDEAEEEDGEFESK